MIHFLLTVKSPRVYDIDTVAKNSGQVWRPELPKMHSRIVSGFFYAQNMHCVMTDCIGKPSGLPFSWMTVRQPCAVCHPSRLATLVTVPKISKETITMSKQSHTGSPSSENHNPDTCPYCRAYASVLIKNTLQRDNYADHIKQLEAQLAQLKHQQGGDA